MSKKYLIRVWYFFCKYIFILIPDKYFLQILFFATCKRLGFSYYKMNLESPETFNEKLNYLKLYNRNELAPVVADKIAVREYVKKIIGAQYLIPAIGIFDSVSGIDFDTLPNKFAMKTNHGSGWNLICIDKSKLNWKIEKERIDKWLKKNAFYLSREWQYKNITPKLICEELLEYEIKDYKFFCSKGKVKLIQVDSNRFSNHQRTIFDTKWNNTGISYVYPNITKEPDKPDRLNEMILLSEKLSKEFIFCRIDLYETQNKVYFGEITIHPEGGVGPFFNRNYDLRMGSLIDISII